ncbi:MAG TPA: hypothetical protein PLP27_05540 [Crocinitomicaceae bacterium]|nr:hypothetical protein [Crocinitomicaceae bacterium]
MDKKISNIKERIIQIADYKAVSYEKFFLELGVTYGNFKGSQKKTSVKSDTLDKIISKYPEINSEWLLTGKGEMLLSEKKENKTADEAVIPFYDDVSSIGGTSTVANMSAVSQPSEWIRPGDWFKNATSAIRHYGDSMNEYPSGCVLVLKEIYDKRIISWGQNYCIETNEVRLTKRLQRGKSEEYVTAYSSNEETYADGTLIHQPIDIPLDAIVHLHLVIGCVVKEHSSGMVGIK